MCAYVNALSCVFSFLSGSLCALPKVDWLSREVTVGVSAGALGQQGLEPGNVPQLQLLPSRLPAPSGAWVAGRQLRAHGALILGGDASEIEAV